VTVNNTSFTVVNGGTIIVTGTAEKDYVLESVIVDGFPVPIADNLTTYSRTFSDIDSNHTISFTAKKVLKFAVSVSTSSNITVTYSGPYTELLSGAGLTVAFKLPQYYDVDTVMVDNAKASLTNMAYAFADINANHKIVVTSKITALGTAFNLLSMPKAFVKDSIFVRDLGTTKWYYYKSTDRDSIFFHPDYKVEIFRDGKLIGNGTWSVSGTDPIIIMVGTLPWRVLFIDEKRLKVILSSINTTDGEDIQFVFTRH
jgi:hypothetical protein